MEWGTAMGQRRFGVALAVIGLVIAIFVMIPGRPALASTYLRAPTVSSTTPSRSFGSGKTFCADATPSGSDAAPLSSSSSYDGVYPCGPIPGASTTYGVPSSSASDASYQKYANFFEYNDPDGYAGFQCVELANRFLWVVDGLTPISGDALTGYSFVDTEVGSGNVPSSERFYNTTASATNHPYLPGDVVSFSGNGGAGHVAIVIDSSYAADDGGTYSVKLMEEDASTTGETTAQVTDWMMGEPADSTVVPYDYIAFPAPQDVSLATLCEGSNVKIHAQNGCPYNGSTTIGSKKFRFVVLVENNDSSVYPDRWDLIKFPKNTCTSVDLTFGMPKSDSSSGDSAWLTVATAVGTVTARAKYGQEASLEAPIDGGSWTLENSASNADDEIAINGTAVCASTSGY